MGLAFAFLPPAVDDPLTAVGDRLPLAWPRWERPASDQAASPLGERPFGLRFAVEPSAPPAPTPFVRLWRYDVDRQIAVGVDGQPWYRQLVDMTMETTGPSPDGTGSTGNEEWTPDYASDDVT